MQTTFPPCYNYTFFHGVASIIFNDEMADLLASSIKQSQMKHPVLDALAADLLGEEHSIVIEETAVGPSYDYGHYMHKGTLTCNQALAFLLSEAIQQSAFQPVPKPLWALQFKLRNFEDAINKPYYNKSEEANLASA